MPEKDARKKIEDAIESLVKAGVDAGIKAILEAVTGKSASTVPENRSQTGPGGPTPPPVTGVTTPPLPLPFDNPPKAPSSTTYHYNGLRASYAPGEAMKFTVVPPPNFSLQGATRLVIVADADRGAVNPERLSKVFMTEPPASQSIAVTAPLAPGKYVVRVDIGLNFDPSSVQEFVVTSPTPP